MSNELTKTDWGYVVPANTKNYNDFYKGNWKVAKAYNNMVQLTQSESEHGDGYYTHSKKNIIIPMKQFQNDFKKVRSQNIVMEEKMAPVEAPKVKPVATKPQKCPAPVMTNKDIQKSVDERKNAWTDDDINSYLKKNGLLRKNCNTSDTTKKIATVEMSPKEEDGARKTINALEAVFNDAFGPGVTDKLFKLFHAGVNWNGIKEQCPVGPHQDYPEEYERKLFPAVDAFQKARDEFGKIMHFFDPFEFWYPGNGGKKTPDKKFEPERPCRYTQEYTKEPRCESKDCKHCKRGLSIN